MPLPKQTININFGQGLDQKTDPKAIAIGKFKELTNRVFNKAGLLSKRNGFGSLPALPDIDATYSTTFGGNLTAIGSKVEAFAKGSKTWLDKGAFQAISLNVLPLARSAINQTQCDAVTASNNYICTVFTQVNAGVSSYYYAVQDKTTGQYILAQTLIPVGSGVVTGSPRVFLLGGYFILVFTNIIAGASHLQYIAISVSSPSTVVKSNTDIAAAYISDPSLAWDGVVVGNKLFIGYNTTSGAQQIKITYLSLSLVVTTPVAFLTSIATTMSLTADITNPTHPVIYASFWDNGASVGQAVAVDQNLNKLMTATQWLATGTVSNVTSTAKSGVLTIVYENVHAYSYDSSIGSNFLSKNTITKPSTVTTGTLGTAAVVVRSVGLASKGFLVNDSMYMLASYSSSFQPTYFLVDLNGKTIAKIAYQNGGGYLTLGLPQAQVIDDSVNIPYLYRDLVQAANKAQGVVAPAGVYSQTGINLSMLSFNSSTLSTSEIGANLNLSGGFLYAYDGNTLNEQNFHVYPDSIKAVKVADPAPTGDVSSSVTPTIITNISDMTGIAVGMTITGTAIPANTVVVSLGVNAVTMSHAATGTHSTETITFTGGVTAQVYYIQVIYQWTDAQGNIFNSAPSIPVTTTAGAGESSILITGPMLRLTYKSSVKIIIYRWSAGQQNYFQSTSITNPLLNSTSTDSWSFTDLLSDSQIIGNGLIYTIGGVIENTGAPACTALTLFDTRQWLIDAEDQNLLWFSKPVIEGAPVEFSDLFTYYIAPNAGVTGSTGPMKCIFPMDDKLVIFKAQSLFYINGTGADITGSNGQYSQPIFITSTIGSVNQRSIVLTPQGLMFQSDKGIWLLRRDLTTTYIGADVDDSLGTTVTSALVVPTTTEVRFTLDNGTTLCYDYFFQEWGTFKNISAVSSTIYEDLHTYVTSTGGVAQETPGAYTDNGNPVLTAFKTGWINLANLQGFERFYYFYFIGQYLSPHKLQIQLSYDYNDTPRQSVIVTPNNFSSSVPSPYGDQPAPFGSAIDLEQWKIYAKIQKCQAFQITMQEIFDPALGVAPGAGLTLSGLNMVIGVKQGSVPIRASQTAG